MKRTIKKLNKSKPCAVLSYAGILLKNFGDYTHDMLREPYRQLVKDCRYGTDGIFANNFLFAVATTKLDMPIRDMSERCCFGHYNN